MTIKINGKDLLKRMFNGVEVSKVMKNGVQIRPEELPPIPVGTGFATFLAGQDFNLAVKTLAGDSPDYYSDIDTAIKKIIQTGTVPSGVTTGILSSRDSDKQIIGWFNNGILYYYTDAASIFLNDDASDMFTSMRALEKIDTRKWRADMTHFFGSMFNDCQSLTGLDAGTRDTEFVFDMSYMFYNCESLSKLDLSNWNVDRVTNMNYMFYNCVSLEKININWRFNSTALEDISQMFMNCSSLTSLDLNNINTSRVRYMPEMFYGCSSLEKIYVMNSFDTSSVVNGVDMFYGAVNIVGGNGTTYDANNVDNGYARIDTPATPGYFTTTPGIYHNVTLGLVSLSSDGSNWITISDVNLGVNGRPSSTAYGKYYQRGNNYGWDWPVQESSGPGLQEVNNYGPGNYYYEAVFRSLGDGGWFQEPNSDLRGGVTNTNASKQGPCPSGFHIPSLQELNNIYLCGANMGAWDINSGNPGLKFIEYLFLNNDAGHTPRYLPVTSMGGVFLRGCTDGNNQKAAMLYTEGGEVLIGFIGDKAQGNSIRPFKNDPAIPDSTWAVVFKPS